MKSKLFASFGCVVMGGFLLCCGVYGQNSSTNNTSHPWQALQPKPYTLSPGPAGTYQLVVAELDHVQMGSQKVLIRVDSRTGQAWRLVQLTDASGAIVFSWMPIAESEIAPN